MIRCGTIGLVSAGFALGSGLAYAASRLIGSCPFTASLRSDPLTLLRWRPACCCSYLPAGGELASQDDKITM